MTQRRFTRVPLQTKVFITSRKRSFAASSLNLSIHGVFVLTHETIPVGEPVEIDIMLPVASSCPHMRIRGVVARAEHSGLALEFDRLDPDIFQSLKNVLYKRTSHRLKPFMGP